MKLLQGDCLEVMKQFSENSIDAICCDPPYGLSFMGKKWDYDVPSLEIWEECLRVLKPGGYLLSFAGTRTQHRMAVRIEDAGFEIRDMIAWVYGSGFPKSLNIGKSVDNLQGNEREDLGEHIQNKKNPESKNRSWQSEQGVGNKWSITKGTSEWEGWGTALKPALEPITVARKPIEGTVAENCLKWGVGGINIDGCRVGTQPHTVHGKEPGNFQPGSGETQKDYHEVTGRFPANLIHDGSDEVVELFPNTVPTSYATQNTIKGGMFGMPGHGTEKIKDTTRSAARFFYCAKASKSERNRGCEELEEQIVNDGRETDIDNAYQRGTTLRKNTHPTVKPIALMEYLIKLVSRDGHTILDPFMGSGSTGIACKKLNRHFIGIEREPDYITIAENRIEAVPKSLF